MENGALLPLMDGGVKVRAAVWVCACVARG